MRDVGGLVWIVFVLFAVISSIVRSARKARATPQRGAVAPSPRAPSLIAQFAQQAQARAATPPKPVPPPPPASPVVAPPRVEPVVVVAQPLQRRANGFFADRRALVRGIIAAEVLGKPLALRDE